MKRIHFAYLALGLMVAAAPIVQADGTDTNTPPKRVRSLEARAQNRRVMEIIGLTRADLKGLAPADRRAKIKAAVQTKLTELEQLKANGTITPEQSSDLALLEKRAHHHKAKPNPDNQ